MEVLSVKDLKFSYYLNETDTFHALQNITFSVEQGEMVLFCGLCGCGKTTLLKLLKEEIRPDGKMEGEIENRYGSMQTGYLFQNPEQQIVCRTVEEELVFGAENMDMPRDEMARSAAELAAYLGIEKMLHESTQSLSGGQKQILNLASLLMMKPRILLLDEPVSQLDPVCTWEFMNLLKKVREDFGLTILVAEHNLDLFLPEADKVIYMENGRINYQGKKDLFIRKMFQEEKKFVEYRNSLLDNLKLLNTVEILNGISNVSLDTLDEKFKIITKKKQEIYSCDIAFRTISMVDLGNIKKEEKQYYNCWQCMTANLSYFLDQQLDLISFCKDYKNNAEILRLSQERELNLKEIINNPMNNQKEKDEKELRKQQKVIADLIQKQESFQPQFETKLKIIEKYRQEQHPVCIRNLYELTLKLIQTKEKALK